MWLRLKGEIRAAWGQALTEAVAAGELPAVAAPSFTLERPRESGHGDLAVNVALLLAKQVGLPPRQVAEILIRYFASPWVSRLEIAGPGFLNLFLKTDWLVPALTQILREGSAYGRSATGSGERIILEFVSANPTGPLNIVSARAAAVGDTLANLLQAAGYRVHREFYVNDAGRQVKLLARSLEVRLREELGLPAGEIPEDGYPGEYLREIARDLASRPESHEWLQRPAAEREGIMAEEAVGAILAEDQAILEAYGVRFDRFYREKDLHRSGAVAQVVTELRRRGQADLRDGALWLRSVDLGDDKDRVLVKADGEYTYLVPDLAYHREKFERGFEQVINLWGPDHHGYIPRLRAGLEALGVEGRLDIMIVQVVRLVRGGEPVRMSKRGGQFIPMAELLEEVGPDAARFFFLLRSVDSPLDFDLDLARLQESNNPVFYVQYAHARISSILRQELPKAEPDYALLSSTEEENLIRHLALFPEEVAEAAGRREPHRLTRYALELASLFHGFYNRHRVLGQEPVLSMARLDLCRAVAQTLRNDLALLGVTAPERM